MAETSNAYLSPCRTYRYQLSRVWSAGPLCMFVGLNPSKADEHLDDPTIRRCRQFTKDLGYAGMVMLNLCAYRSTDPANLRAPGVAAVGPDNDAYLTYWAEHPNIGAVIACWGAGAAKLGGRELGVIELLLKATGRRLFHLGLTAAGHPKHPLYLRSDTKPQLWPEGHRPRLCGKGVRRG